ncbi:hypothetical protein N7492_005785 [Penicillium capsulatum]|uniref:Uncharacterized protein n=1 Tax=Penicillium capsulatum TaxID=69766 RepID=A0A9W9IGG5_9EURO|nr:hypothetical protein N7492_005785 [Penicillium capsulatum]KAJ6135115.1 hypothetical protein N7512_000275 [Penicillium capsulatum]
MTVRPRLFLPLRGRVVARPFSVSRPRWEAGPLPAKKPVGAFRGGVFGFLFGAVAAGASVYYYVLGDYRLANEMLSDDISTNHVNSFLPVWEKFGFHFYQALQSATIKLQSYITELEFKVDKLQKK